MGQKDFPFAGQAYSTKHLNTRVISVCASATHAFSGDASLQTSLPVGLGIDGDALCGIDVRHHSRAAQDPAHPNLRQVHLIDAVLFNELAARYFKVPPGQRGKNITTRDLDLLALPVDSWLHIGESAVVKLTGLCNPCEQPN